MITRYFMYMCLVLATGSNAFSNGSPNNVRRSLRLTKKMSLGRRHTLTKKQDPCKRELCALAIDSVETGVQILPAKQPLDSFFTIEDGVSGDEKFSILSWNILLPNSQDNWWNHKMYDSSVPMEKRNWSHRQTLIQERLTNSGADIICIQEADGDTFEDDFAFMKDLGYESCLHKKYRFRCATFFKDNKFNLERDAHKDRTLVTALTTRKGRKLLNVINCHLSGGAAPQRRLRQVHDGLEQVRKWKNAAARTLQKQQNANRPSPKIIAKAEENLCLHENAGGIVCGDFNSDGNTGVRHLLVEGSIDPHWREPQYPDVPLTSKRKEHAHAFVDAAEIAYGTNVCDGDYGEYSGYGCRPATYVVPNLASLLLSSVDGEKAPRTEFGHHVAKGLAETLELNAFCEHEIEQAFESIDQDGNQIIDESEVHDLLENVYAALYGEQIDKAKNQFFSGFRGSTIDRVLSREQFTERILLLQKELESKSGESELTKALVGSLGLVSYSKKEIETAFDSVDLDGNNQIDEDEIRVLLENVYLETYGKQIEKEKEKFFGSFQGSMKGESGLSLDQFTERAKALQQELEGGSQGSELVEIKTEQDAQIMIARFSPVLKNALDQVFNMYSTNNGETLSEEEISKFLIKVNGQLGRGGTWRHTTALFQKKEEASKPAIMTRQEWYGIFARELAEGKWWQVVHDLEVCGVELRSKASSRSHHYQGWLDYVYFDSLRLKCLGVQEALTSSEFSRIYDEGDALPNAWHPSDHLPIAAVFSWD